MSSWSEAEINESLLGIEFVSSVEELINQKRNTGPFGGASIESTSVGEIIRKSREKKSQFKPQMSTMLPSTQTASEPYFARNVQVFLEDKYQRSNRFLVESYKLQLSIIPKDLNGFEYLCHPNLEKEEDFSRYFRSWQSTTLFSLCSLTQNAPIVRYFLAPLSETEREVSIELRKRFNLTVAVDENLTSISQDPKPSPGLVSGSMYGPLQPMLSSRQDMKRIIVKMKFHVLNEFSQILTDLKSADKKQKLTIAPPLSNMTTAVPDSSVVRRGGHGQGRNRFFSEEIGEVGGFASRNQQQDVNCSYKTTNDRNALGGTLGNRSVSNLFSNQEALRAVNQLSINNNSEEASASFKSASSHRPFKVQENILEERMQQQLHRRRVSVGQNSLGEVSLTNFYRKNTDYITGVTTAAQAY